jgi:hypothetical protein
MSASTSERALDDAGGNRPLCDVHAHISELGPYKTLHRNGSAHLANEAARHAPTTRPLQTHCDRMLSLRSTMPLRDRCHIAPSEGLHKRETLQITGVFPFQGEASAHHHFSEVGSKRPLNLERSDHLPPV